MSREKRIYTDVEVSLDEWDDDELKKEMERRGFFISKNKIPDEAMQISAMAAYEAWKLRGNGAMDKVIDFLLQSAGRIA